MGLNRTHYRRSGGARAQLLSDRDGTALYLVDAPRRHGRGRTATVKLGVRYASCSSARFHRDFAEAPA